MSRRKQSFIIFITLLFIGVMYLLFPTHNSTFDALAFAADIKFKFPTMFRGHHLLYTPLYYCFYLPIQVLFPKADILHLTKIFNALFSVGILWVVYKIMKNIYKFTTIQMVVALCFIAFSFGFWRLTVDNESYVVGLFFAVLGSRFFLKYQYNKDASGALWVVLCGLFSAMACLWHQIYVFWWLGLWMAFLIDKKKRSTIAYFSLPALMVPLAYILVVKFNYHQPVTVSSVTKFIFHSYTEGIATITLSWNTVLFTIVGVARTFLQVYPTLLILLQKSIFYYLPLILAAVLILFFLKRRKSLISKVSVQNQNKSLKSFVVANIIIFIGQFLFAVLSMGNAKFILMLPVLLVFILPYYLKIEPVFAKWVVAFLFLWNFLYGIWPDYHYNFKNSQYVIHFLKQHPKATIVVSDNTVVNRWIYQTGKNFPSEVINFSAVNNHRKMDSLTQIRPAVYTIMAYHPVVINRDYFTYDYRQKEFWKYYAPQKVDSFTTFYGKVYISRLRSSGQ